MQQPPAKFFPLRASGNPARQTISPDALGGLNHQECGSHAGPWYCAEYKPGKLLLAARNLARQNFIFHVPLMQSLDKAGRPRWRPLIPGYLFVTFHLYRDRWEHIFHTYGMKRVMVDGAEVPIPIPPAAMHAFLEPDVEVDIKPPPIPPQPIEKGATVDIISGPLEGHRGICTFSSAGRVKLLLAVMGGELEIDVKNDERILRSVASPQKD